MVVVAEGIEPETGRVFPAGAREDGCEVRIIMDPVDGTRGLMYDKRAAWSLAGAAPNKGPRTRPVGHRGGGDDGAADEQDGLGRRAVGGQGARG